MTLPKVTAERSAVYAFASASGMSLGKVYELVGWKERRMQCMLASPEKMHPVVKARLYVLTKNSVFTPVNEEEEKALQEEQKQMFPPLASYLTSSHEPEWTDALISATQTTEDLGALWTKLAQGMFPVPIGRIQKEQVSSTKKLLRLLSIHLAYYATHSDEESRLAVHNLLHEDITNITTALEMFHREFPMDALRDLLRHRAAQRIIKKNKEDI